MVDRLLRAFETVQDKYLRDREFADAEVRHRHVRQLREIQDWIAGELWDDADLDRAPDGLRGAEAVNTALQAYARAEDIVIEREIIGRLPRRMIHEMHNAWAYREADLTEPLDPAEIDSGPLDTLHWYDWAAEARVDAPERVMNASDCQGPDPIEDVALAPKVHWTEAGKKAALERAVDTYGLEPGQWIELEWPPTAHLWDPGDVYITEFEQCPAHADEDREEITDDCPDCQGSVREVVETMAHWKWTTTLRIHEIEFDHEGRESDQEVYTDQAHEVAVTEQDPRELMVGPPGAGTRW
jgi:hypothetical protein